MTTTANWDLQRARHWHLFRPPARPSAGEIALYAGGLANLSGEAALLGATPELRLLAHRRGLRLTAYDRSRGVFDQLCPATLPAEDAALVEGDWLQTIRGARFDVVLADGSLNMLPKSRHRDLLAGVAALLRPGGTALVRVHLCRPPRYGSAVDVFAAYRRGELAGPVFTATRTQLDMLWLDPETDSVCFQAVIRRLAALHASGQLRPEEFAAYDTLAPYNRIELHYSRREQFEAMASSWFEIGRVDSGQDYADHEQHPVYALRRR